MSASSEFEPAARQDYGPTTSSENLYEPVLDHKLAENMSVPSIRTPVLRAVPLSPNDGDPEPDSTYPENIAHAAHNNFDKEVEYHIAEKPSDIADMSVDSLSGIVRLDESTIDNIGRITYPLIQQEPDDSSDANYAENPIATPIQASLHHQAIVQNITKLPPNFTLNVDAAVGSITAIQNVSQEMSGASTLWLPTILTTSTATDCKSDAERTQAGVSQIIITSESYMSAEPAPPPPPPHAPRRAHLAESYAGRPKASKVQILSNVSIPKPTTYSQQCVAQSAKELTAPVYATQNHVYKLNANLISQKHFGNSVLNAKTPKSQSLIGVSTLATSVANTERLQAKSVAYSHTFTKGTNLNKTLNKVNNGANLNAVVAASSGNTQCHILSRVVSGPNKLSVHSGRKSVNTFKASKNSSLSSNQKQSRAIKIIQQTGSHKSDGKNWPVANVATYKSQQPTYGVVDTNPKIQKADSPPHKMSLQKVAAKGERLVLQSPCGPVLISTAPLSTCMPRAPHYVQSGHASNLRYAHHTYGSDTHHMSSVSQVSANQQLTAQILQSLAQPKLMLTSNQQVIKHALAPPADLYVDVKPPGNQRRIVFGDPSTLLTADDILGMEERPNLTEELRRYPYSGSAALAFIMLDHTYSQPAQKQALPPPPPRLPSPAPAQPPPPPALPPAPPQQPPPLPAPAQLALYRRPAPPPPLDDDAGSVISSEGSRRADEPGAGAGSDTETAPEVEEEGRTRCVCDFTHDDGYMICCDRCGEWQHVDCMGIDRGNIPDAYMCAACAPRPVDRRHARAIQLRKREELSALADSDSEPEPGRPRRRLLTVTTYANTSGAPPPPPPPPPPPLLPPLGQPRAAAAPGSAAGPAALAKRQAKRPKKADALRKGAKRKLAEKRVKRKKEMMLNRSRYGSGSSGAAHRPDSYESAMTNHYSPELRAKIAKYGNSRAGDAGDVAALAAHLCTTVPHAGGKILIATRDLPAGAPVTELRGKYMLSAQHRSAAAGHAAAARHAAAQKPGPFVFFYRLPRDTTQICIDTRTYGNEARYVRRSCKPNAELRHAVVKGALHVYLVTTGAVQSNTEITVPHDTTAAKQPCACGNPKHCKLTGPSVGAAALASRRGDLAPRDKRSRARAAAAAAAAAAPPPAPASPPLHYSPLAALVKTEKTSPIKQEPGAMTMSPVRSAVMALDFDQPIKTECEDMQEEEEERPPVEEEEGRSPVEEEEERPPMDLTAKEEMKIDIDEPDFPFELPQNQPQAPELPEPARDPIKTEIANPVKEETETPKPEEPESLPEHKKLFPTEDKITPKKEKLEKVKEEVKSEDIERPVTREVTAKSACQERSSRSSKGTARVGQDSLDDKTDDSQEKLPTTKKEKDKKKTMTREERKMEAIMKAFERMEKAEQRKQEVKERQKRRESDPHPNVQEKEEDDDAHEKTKRRRKRKGRARTTSQCNRRRLNSASSDVLSSCDEGSPAPPPRRVSAPAQPERRASPPRRLADLPQEALGLSSACLLVEAAVGCVESAFKLPKTKKTMATEWVGRSPERTPSPYRSPYRTPLVSATSLDNLVRVASTMIGDLSGGHFEHDELSSPPRTPGRDRSRPPKKCKRVLRSTPPADVPEVTQHALPQHSAKKRWLRQAISEESDSPTIESPPSEMVTPLKKRRLARESVCYEPISVPCNDETSPTRTSEDSPVKDGGGGAARSIMESGYLRDRTRSGDSGQGSDELEHCDALRVELRGPRGTEHLRRIIGVPLPREPPKLTKLEDITTTTTNNNNNNNDDMDVDPQPPPQPPPPPPPSLDERAPPSADTSGGSSPQRDDMDDIQKKIHSFHTENILMLKSRNKKPPKEKRKKVNLNFDLNMVDDRVSIQLRTENEPRDTNGDAHDQPGIQYVATEGIPLPPVETIPLPAAETIPLPGESVAAPAPDPGRPVTVSVTEPIALPADEPAPQPAPAPVPAPVPAPASPAPAFPRFASTGLFSGMFSAAAQINDNVPGMQLSRAEPAAADDLKLAHEILTRVNSMDAGSSALFSGATDAAEPAEAPGAPSSPPSPRSPAGKPYCPRSYDPRLNPPPQDKPKPVRRKLSISEYRKRYLGALPDECGREATPPAGGWSSESSGAGSLSPLRLEAAAAAAADDLEQRLHRALSTAPHRPAAAKGFDAQPTASECQRENLSSRLRREFGLALPDDEDTRPPTDAADARLSSAGLAGASLPVATLPGVSLPGASLPGASLSGAGLQGASLPGAGLQGASLPGAGLPGASLQGASLPGDSTLCDR